MPPSKKFLKILSEEPKPWGRLCKDVLEKRTQLDTLSQPKKRVKINETTIDAGNLEANHSKVI